MKRLIIFIIIALSVLLIWNKQKKPNSKREYPSPAFSDIMANPRQYDTIEFSGWVDDAIRFAGNSIYKVHDNEGCEIFIYTTKPAPEKGNYLQNVIAIPHQIMKFRGNNVFIFEEISPPG